MATAYLHKRIYLGAQRLRGRPVGPLLRRLAEWDRLDARSYRELCERRLVAMLAHAKDTVPLYSSGGWRSARADDVSAWPVLERRSLVEDRARLIARGPNGRSRPLRLFTRRSSASTGVPIAVDWDRIGIAWSWAAEYHPMRWHGLDIGAKTLRMWGSASALENWVLNRHFVPAHALTPEALDRARRFLIEERPALVWGVPSAVVQLARHASRHPSERRLVPYVKVGGEQVFDFQRDEIRWWLGARIIEAYGCTEVGPIAAECPAGSMHVLGTNVHVEIFRGDTPVPAGEPGDVVVTTLVNRGMPLVRCRVGDTARLSPEPCACALPQPVLLDLRGRSADLLLAVDGTPVHGSALGEGLRRYSGKPALGNVQQILFSQIDRRLWDVQVQVPPDVELPLLVGQIHELLEATFGRGCRAEVRLVPEIVRERSGKFRYYRAPAATVHRPAAAQASWISDEDGSERVDARAAASAAID